MSIRITELDAITSLQSGDYIAVDNESTGTHKFKALDISANVAGNIANTYSSSASYAIGQYCLYDNNLYKCTTTISTPEAWNSSHWIQVTVGEGLYEKVDKVSGKGLSTNDFTNEYKQKLGGIEAGAEVNVQANWAEPNTSSDSYIKNKPGNATTSASGFMSASDKQKLDNIEAGAEVNVQPNWAEDDSSKDDYIKNKPTIDTALSTSSDNAVRNSAITAGINQVQGNLDTEITNRQNAVSGEQLARENADSALDGRLDTVEETLPNKANINGSYEEMTVGSAEQLISTESIEDTTLYTFRASGGGMDIGDRETDKLVGGTVAWNQLCNYEKFMTYSDNPAVVLTNNNDGSVTIVVSNDISSAITVSISRNSSSYYVKVPKDHKFLIYDEYPSISGIEYRNDYNGVNLGYNTIKVQAQASGYILLALRLYNLPAGTYTLKPSIFDLTQMFGSTIADALYAMEQVESGSGVVWFKKYFPKPYYAYDAGSLQSVNVASHDMTGFNQWDEEWEAGAIASATGANSSQSNAIRSKNYIPVIGGQTYFINKQSSNLRFYDADKNYLGSDTAIAVNTNTFEVPSNARYMRFYVSNYGTTYNHDICINRVWTGNRNGEYEPYELHSYAYDESVELRGIPSLVDGELIYDGDIYEADGTVSRKYGIKVFDGTTGGWSEYQGAFYQYFTGYAKRANAIDVAISDRLQFVKENAGISALIDAGRGTFSLRYDQDSVQIYPTDSTIDTSAKLNTWLASNPVTVVYELATPTTEQATGFTNPQVVDAFGTEEYVDAGVKNGTRDVSIPVGHVTQYMANLRDKLQHLPNLAKDDGDYFVNQTGTQMKLKKVEGYYEDLVAGMADNLNTNIRTNDQTPYLFRTSGGSVDIGDREYINGIVGGTVAFNQLVNPSTLTKSTSDVTMSESGGVVTFTAPATNEGVYFQYPQIAEHKMLVTVDIKLTTATTMLRIDIWGSLVHAPRATTDWQTVSFAFVTGSSRSDMRLRILDTRTADWDAVQVKNAMVIDLTQMFGSTIADYIYSLEQATAGAGVAFFKTLFPKPYYAYNSGELMSVSGLVSHDMVGFNAWDEEWEVGSIRADTGENEVANTGIRSKNYIPVIPNATYFFHIGSTYSTNVKGRFYDADKNYLGTGAFYKDQTFAIPSNAYFMRFALQSAYGTTYNHDICINLSWDGSEDGNYEPYQKWSYPLDSDLTLRGTLKLDANNNLYADGDIYPPSGQVSRKWSEEIDLGALAWSASGGQNDKFYASLSTRASENFRNGVCSCYPWGNVYGGNTDKTIQPRGGLIWLQDSQFNNSPTNIATVLSGQKITYELATPTTETADPYTSPQIVNDFGTEEFVISNTVAVPIPVGHNTDYPINLKSKLEMAPDSPDGDGDYIVRQTNGTNEYVPLIIEDQLPAVPSTDGTYTLTVTIASGEVTYSWT